MNTEKEEKEEEEEEEDEEEEEEEESSFLKTSFILVYWTSFGLLDGIDPRSEK